MTDKFGAEYHRVYYKIRRRAVLTYLGNQCVLCGTLENLEVDHRDRTTKSFNISYRLSVENNKEELDKCQLLCKECHRNKTAQENQGFTHGTVYAWMRIKCQCETCLNSKRQWYDARNAKRRKQSL